MNYIIYDLEFNQKENTSDSEICKKQDLMPFEIIQIGALKLNENFKTIDTFNSLIKPTLYKTIHPYIENLTNITNEKIALCKTFIDVYEDFRKFIGDDSILCVWGVTDIKELIRNINFHNLSFYKNPQYIDIQKYASTYLKTPNKSRIGLRNAIEILNIPVEGQFHDALNDAYYTGEIFKVIYEKDMQPISYSSSSTTRLSYPKEKTDIDALINQFEKMYNRKMTTEEKSIIKLAYMMGKTKQFIL